MNPTTLPNLLTFMRIALIPVVVILFYFDRPWSNWIAACFFIIACITDYLDGYFARALEQTTRFGIFLDPIADKLPGISLVAICRDRAHSGRRRDERCDSTKGYRCMNHDHGY